MVASVLHDAYPGRLDTPLAKSIINVVQKRIGMNLFYSTALRGKKLTFNNVQGSPEESYGMLYPYLHMLEKVNLRTVTSVELTAAKKFKYLFIVLGACVEGFRAIRKVLVVDATFLSGSYGGMLVFATAQDPDRHNYPVAFGVIDGENNRSWGHASIIKAVSGVYPSAHQDFVAAKFRDCAHIYTQSEFIREYGDFRVRFPKAAEYLDKSVTLEKWARCCFAGDKYNIETSNAGEYRKESCGLFNNKRVVPVLENEKHTRCAIASLLVVTELNSYELEYSVNGMEGKTYVVNLIVKSCCCRQFDIDKFPCEHAIAAAKKLMSTEDGSANIEVYDLCSKYYLIETWALAYHRTIYSVPHHTEWIIPDNIKELVVLPPDVKKKPDRNKEKRVPGPGERRRRTKNKEDPHLNLEACFRRMNKGLPLFPKKDYDKGTRWGPEVNGVKIVVKCPKKMGIPEFCYCGPSVPSCGFKKWWDVAIEEEIKMANETQEDMKSVFEAMLSKINKLEAKVEALVAALEKKMEG
ncbi:uncharacterized protein LOC112084170 [Eutrema salsugineum]|uniref:uncharacterized protein LOC112084170 n=1 Tax=Eutrema salsugineum TaxID=72664 RepID=UPI000CED6F4D|nr:uncharacterized protein LOC112084170 [Eutrema salsugineum]